MREKLIAVIILLACVGWPAFAVFHYVRAGATGLGTGQDWVDAWTDLPPRFVRGDTYYLAGGRYGPHRFDTPDSGAAYVYIKRATVADHGTSWGWDDSYAQGQALFSTTTGILWNIATDFWDIDGSVGTGPGGQGIKLSDTSMNEEEPCVYIEFGNTGSFVNFRHVELQGPPHGFSNPTRMFFVNAINTNNLTFQYDYFHESGKTWMTFGQNNQNILIEHCWFRNAGAGDPALHSDGISLFTSVPINCTIRYNVFENMIGQSNTTYIEPQGQGGGGISVYGNVFFASSADEFVSQGIFSYTTTDYGSDIRIFNNTIYGLHGFYPGVTLTAGCTNVLVTDNAWQNCVVTPAFSTFPPGNTASSNILNTGEIHFVDPLNGNFNLAAPTAAGAPLGSPFDQDPNGSERGTGGMWNIGAYQFVGSIAALSPPTRLSVGP